MQAQHDYTSEKEKENKEFARFLIRPALQKTKQFLKFLKVESLTQKIDI